MSSPISDARTGKEEREEKLPFEMGAVHYTPGIEALRNERETRMGADNDFFEEISLVLNRHRTGLWDSRIKGEEALCEEDKAENMKALKHGGRILSVQHIERVTAQADDPADGDVVKVWVITEARHNITGGRWQTTILLPDEY